MRKRREKLIFDSIRRFRLGASAFRAQQQLATRFFRTLQLTDVPRQLLDVQSCRLRLFERSLDVLQISLVRETDDEDDGRGRDDRIEAVIANKNRSDSG